MSITATQGELAFATQYTRYEDGYPLNKKARGKITFANNSLTSHTVTLGAVTYSFQTTPSAANHVQIGATVDASARNLADAINGTSNSGVFAGTQASYVAWAEAASNVVYLTAWTPNKTVGNSITLSASGANISVTAFSGGITGGVAQKAFAIVRGVAQPAAGTDNFVAGGITYAFVSTTPAAYASNTCQVRIGSSLAETIGRLARAIDANGVAGTEYSSGTPANSSIDVESYTSFAIHIEADAAGSAGNSLTISRVGTGLELSGATLAGGSDASFFQKSQLTWVRTRSNDIDYDKNDMQDVLPLEIGGTMSPTGAYKQGVNARGGASFMPRLERSFGDLLLGALGRCTTSNPLAGVYEHVFTFNTNELDIPWMAVRKMIPGRDEVFGHGVIGWDNKVNLLRLSVAATAPIQAQVQWLGRVAELDNHPELWVGNTFEDFVSIPMACFGSFLLPTIPGLPRQLPITQAIVELANATTTEREEMIVGSFFMDDVVPRQRSVSIRTVYKWRDAALAQYIFTNQLRGTAWSPTPFTTSTSGSEYAFDLLMKAPFNIPGTSEPYSLRVRGNYAVWQPGAMRLRAGDIVTMELAGTVLANQNAYVEFVLRNGIASYAVPSEA